MRAILASPRGFCAGVNMAIESLDLAIRVFGTPIYVYHEIVHNRHVVESFRDKGAVFVNQIDEVPRRSDAVVLRARRVAGHAAASGRAAAARHRCHLPAGHQGASRSHAIRARRLHDRVDRTRGTRRSDWHDGRSAAGHSPGGDRAGRRCTWICRPTRRSRT